MSRNLAALIALAVVFSGACALSPQSVEAKTSRNIAGRARNYFVPPPPPYTPSIVTSALGLGMTNAPGVTADVDHAFVETAVNSYNKYIFRHNEGDVPQVVPPNPYLSYDKVLETRVQKQVDDFDSEISSTQKEIGKLLDL